MILRKGWEPQTLNRCTLIWILFSQDVDLSSLEEPFGQQEIDDIIRHLSSDKSSGPDGFNNEFMKKCWHLIKEDFYSLCNAFYLGQVCL